MHYFTYIVRLIGSDKYYVGRHSTKKSLEKDTYKGSGKWVRSIHDKSLLEREILETFSSEKDLLRAEEILISEHIGKPGCMNFNERPVGFSSVNNPNKDEAGRARMSERLRGANNPMFGRTHSAEAKAKISESSKLHNPSRDDPAVRAKISEKLKGKNKGKKRSPELKAFFSKQRKEQYANGRKPGMGMLGKHHTDEHKQYMSDLFKSKPDVECEYCGKSMKKPQYTRWHGIRCKSKPTCESER